MVTSLSLVAALLTTALSLLAFVQQNPNLPQASRDNARQIAEAAIVQATTFLTSSSTSPAAVPQISTSTKSTLTKNPVKLELKMGKVTITSNTAQISWSTNIPVSSKVTLTKIPVSLNLDNSQYLPSANGISTQGLVSVVSLEPNTEYTYTIEAGKVDTVEKSGTFITAKSAEQKAAEEAEAQWWALPICPATNSSGVCRKNDLAPGWTCSINARGQVTGCGG